MAPKSAPWTYRRADGLRAILYVDTNRHVHEVTGTNLDYNLSPIFAAPASPAPANGLVPDVIGYVRSDNKTAVVYINDIQHVIELLGNPGDNPQWVVYDLTVIGGGPEANKRSAFPYVRSDGYNTIVYVASDNRIHELAGPGSPVAGASGPWGDADLLTAAGETQNPSTDPWGYKRSDNYNCVVFVGLDGQMHELALYPGSTWQHGVLPASSPLGGLLMRPSGYVRGDGFNTVVYVSGDMNVHELALVGGGWADAVLPGGGALPSSQVFGHRPPGARGSVLFQGTKGGAVHGYELSLPNGGNWSPQEF